MTPEAQRIAIAEACGWFGAPLKDAKGHLLMVPPWAKDCEDAMIRYAYTLLPDYLSDLNAMHEAEKTLKGDQICQYANWLWAQVPCDGEWGDMIWHATAAQRAQAFLRTIGKWEDSK